MRVPPRTKPEGAVFEVRLENRFEHQQHGHLSDPVPDRGNPQRTEPAIRLRDVDTTHRLRAIGPRPQRLREVVEKRGHTTRVRLDGVQRHAIHARRPPILPHPPPRRVQHVATVDAVDQGIEPKRRVLLRLATEFPAQQGDPEWQVGLRHKALSHPVRNRASVAQAAPPLIARNMREVRPLRSTGVAPLRRYYEPVRLPAEAGAWLWIPTRRCTRTSPGLPESCISLSTRALPTHPGRSDACTCSLLPHRSQASAPSEEWPPPMDSRGRIGFACAGLASSLSSLASDSPPQPWSGDRSVSRPWLPADAGPKLHGERAIHMTDTSQSAREMSVTGTPKNRRSEDPKLAVRVRRHALRASGSQRIADASST
jgi:hypothetical protein